MFVVDKDPKIKGLDIAKRIVEGLESIILFTVGFNDYNDNKNIINLGMLDKRI